MSFPTAQSARIMTQRIIKIRSVLRTTFRLSMSLKGDFFEMMLQDAAQKVSENMGGT